MADGTLQILGLGTSAVPLEYTASGDQSLDLVAVNADYDGSGSMVDWQPVVEIISTAGHVMARGVGETIPAGDSVSVTFAPFLKTATSTAPPGTGIQFNVDNEGGWFELGSGSSIPSGTMAPSGVGIKDTGSGGGVGIWDGDQGGGVTLISGDASGFGFGFNGINLYAGPGGGAINLIGTTDVSADNASISASADITLTTDNTLAGTGHLVILNLPIVNPGGSGIVWNNGGVLSIT